MRTRFGGRQESQKRRAIESEDCARPWSGTEPEIRLCPVSEGEEGRFGLLRGREGRSERGGGERGGEGMGRENDDAGSRRKASEKSGGKIIFLFSPPRFRTRLFCRGFFCFLLNQCHRRSSPRCLQRSPRCLLRRPRCSTLSSGRSTRKPRRACSPRSRASASARSGTIFCRSRLRRPRPPSGRIALDRRLLSS